MATNSADPFGPPWRLKQHSADPAGIDRAQRSKKRGREETTRGQKDQAFERWCAHSYRAGERRPVTGWGEEKQDKEGSAVKNCWASAS